MRITNKNNTKLRKEKVYESDSFKDGQFTEEELKQYGLSDNEIPQSLNIRYFYRFYSLIKVIQKSMLEIYISK